MIAWRLVRLLETDQPRERSRSQPRFVGREYELELLENTLSRVVHDNRAHLFTIYGEPGVGKSRLAKEFIEGVESASVLVGRSLPYGEGVTYWPLAEMVKVAAGITDDDPVKEAVAKLRAQCGDDAVADLLALAVGVLEGIETERSQQDIAWAANEWAAELADARPLILVFEDVHWAEEPAARPDRAPRRAGQGIATDDPLPRIARAPRHPAGLGWWTSCALPRSSSSRSTRRRARSCSTRSWPTASSPTSERRTLLEKTEGNPLFVEGTTRMLLEGGTAAKRIPDTLQAMIAARIDRLPRAEKQLLQRAAVIGRIFWEGAVARLLPDVEDLEPVLDDLLLRDFVHPREPLVDLGTSTPYRFKHVLIRDVAYAGLAKASRAELHQQVADWLTEIAGEELVEIRAYHLDHAATLLEELDGVAPPELAARAAAALEKAGRRALAREANNSARAAARSRGRARADVAAPFPRRARRPADRRPAGAGRRDGARLQRRDRGW